jgi:hypothetical protein
VLEVLECRTLLDGAPLVSSELLPAVSVPDGDVVPAADNVVPADVTPPTVTINLAASLDAHGLFPGELFPVGSGSSPEGPELALADVNGDGRLDLLTANESSDSVSVLLGRGASASGFLRVQWRAMALRQERFDEGSTVPGAKEMQSRLGRETGQSTGRCPPGTPSP